MSRKSDSSGGRSKKVKEGTVRFGRVKGLQHLTQPRGRFGRATLYSLTSIALQDAPSTGNFPTSKRGTANLQKQIDSVLIKTPNLGLEGFVLCPHRRKIERAELRLAHLEIRISMELLWQIAAWPDPERTPIAVYAETLCGFRLQQWFNGHLPFSLPWVRSGPFLLAAKILQFAIQRDGKSPLGLVLINRKAMRLLDSVAFPRIEGPRWGGL